MYSIDIERNDPDYMLLGIQVANGECPNRGMFYLLSFGFLIFTINIYKWRKA